MKIFESNLDYCTIDINDSVSVIFDWYSEPELINNSFTHAFGLKRDITIDLSYVEFKFEVYVDGEWINDPLHVTEGDALNDFMVNYYEDAKKLALKSYGEVWCYI